MGVAGCRLVEMIPSPTLLPKLSHFYIISFSVLSMMLDFHSFKSLQFFPAFFVFILLSEPQIVFFLFFLLSSHFLHIYRLEKRKKIWDYIWYTKNAATFGSWNWFDYFSGCFAVAVDVVKDSAIRLYGCLSGLAWSGGNCNKRFEFRKRSRVHLLLQNESEI